MSSFDVDISRFVKKAGDRIELFLEQFGQDLGEEVVRNTPVDTGFLRGSWTAGINTPGLEEGAIGADSTGRIIANLQGIKAGDTLIINNTAEYAVYVEYGDHASAGFVRDAVNRAESIAANALRKVK